MAARASIHATLVLGLVLGLTGSALADTPDSTAVAPAPASKKQALLITKQRALSRADALTAKSAWQRELERRVGKPPTELVNIYNTWTHEYLALDARLPDSADTPVVPAEHVDRFLRCHFTNQPTHMDPRLIRTLLAAALHFHVTRIDVVSGFRSPKYNMILHKKGREVSRKSQHPRGNAVDFRLPGVAVARVHAWAQSLRMGGVGLYPNSGFIHVDTARVRYWTGN